MAAPIPASSAVSAEDRKKLRDRLARIEGQLRGIQKMIGAEAECEAVVQQMAAAQGALRRTMTELIACAVAQRMAASEAGDADLQAELSKVISLLAKYG